MISTLGESLQKIRELAEFGEAEDRQLQQIMNRFGQAEYERGTTVVFNAVQSVIGQMGSFDERHLRQMEESLNPVEEGFNLSEMADNTAKYYDANTGEEIKRR